MDFDVFENIEEGNAVRTDAKKGTSESRIDFLRWANERWQRNWKSIFKPDANFANTQEGNSSQLCEENGKTRECLENCEENIEEDNAVRTDAKNGTSESSIDFLRSVYDRRPRSLKSCNFGNLLTDDSSIYFFGWVYDRRPTILKSFSDFGANFANCFQIYKRIQVKERVAKTSPSSRLSSALFSRLVFLSTPLICAGAVSTCNFTSSEEGSYTLLNCYFTDDLTESQQTVYVDYFQRGALNHPENLITCKWNNGNIFCKNQFHYTLVGNVTTHLSVKFSLQPRMGKYVCNLFGNDATANKPCNLSAAGGGDSEDNISTSESIFATDVKYVVGVCCLLFSCIIF